MKKLIFAMILSLLCPLTLPGSQQKKPEVSLSKSIEESAQTSPAVRPITLADAEEVFEDGRKAQRGSG